MAVVPASRMVRLGETGPEGVVLALDTGNLLESQRRGAEQDDERDKGFGFGGEHERESGGGVGGGAAENYGGGRCSIVRNAG